MVSFDSFLSRILHIGSVSIVFTHALSGYVYKSNTLTRPWVIPVLAAVALVSGLYNAGKARPSRFTKSGANKYRLSVYLKIPLLVAFTPTFDSIVGPKYSSIGKACVAVLLVILGTRARFLREGETLKQPDTY